MNKVIISNCIQMNSLRSVLIGLGLENNQVDILFSSLKEDVKRSINIELKQSQNVNLIDASEHVSVKLLLKHVRAKKGTAKQNQEQGQISLFQDYFNDKTAMSVELVGEDFENSKTNDSHELSENIDGSSIVTQANDGLNEAVVTDSEMKVTEDIELK